MQISSRIKQWLHRAGVSAADKICWYFVFIAVLASVSCGEDPELVEKRDQQKKEITQLNSELAVVLERLKNIPPDVTQELAVAKLLEEKTSAEIESLESEIAVLEADKTSQQQKLQAYQMKYRLK
jgi:C4-dicarboxylate-specific signal transduction histidine kinase